MKTQPPIEPLTQMILDTIKDLDDNADKGYTEEFFECDRAAITRVKRSRKPTYEMACALFRKQAAETVDPAEIIEEPPPAMRPVPHGPRAIAPRVGGPERHAGIEMVDQPVSGTQPTDVATLAAAVAQILSGMGFGGGNGQPAGVDARPNPVLRNRQTAVALKPSYGQGWNRPHKAKNNSQ